MAVRSLSWMVVLFVAVAGCGPKDDAEDSGDSEDSGETAPSDADGDGYTVDDGDCDDEDSDVYPGAIDWADGADSDCDGHVDLDLLGSDVLSVTGDTGDRMHNAVIVENFDGSGELSLVGGAPNYLGGGVCDPSSGFYVFTGPITTDLVPSDALATFTGDTLTADCAGYSVAAGDIDGDGYGDVVTGAPESNTVYWLFGGASVGGSYTPSSTGSIGSYSAAANSSFGKAVVLLDFDDDGYDDLVVGATDYTPYSSSTASYGGALFFEGSPTGLTYSSVLYSPATTSQAGFSLAAGDITGSGAEDLLVGSPGRSTGAGTVHLIAGGSFLSSDAFSTHEDMKFSGSNTEALGYAVSSPGDIDNDGKDDILIGAPGNQTNTNGGAAYLFLTGTLSTTPDMTFYGVTDSEAGRAVSGVPDLDGDGIPELAIGASAYSYGGFSEPGAVHIVLSGSVVSGSSMTLSDADLTFTGTFDNNVVGTSLTNGADITGAPSLLIGAAGSSGGTGHVYLWSL